MEKSAIQILFSQLEIWSEKPAIIVGDKCLKFGQLLSMAHDLVHLFEKEGIEPGQTLIIDGDYSAETIALFIAAALHNLVLVPLLPSELNSDKIEQLGPHYKVNQKGEISKHITNNRAALLPEQKHFPKLIIFTSGSTGKPKGVIHNLNALIEAHLTGKSRNLSIVLFLLFDHIGGINTMLKALCGGLCMVVAQTKSTDELIDLMHRHQVNILPTTPSFIGLLLLNNNFNQSYLPKLKLISYGTEPMPPVILQKLKNRLPHVKISQTYGTTETGILPVKSNFSQGTALHFDSRKFDYKIIDNLLYIRSKTQAIGKLGSNETTENQWIATGDRVERAADGMFKILGNERAIINVGGQKVSAIEVESVILQLETIADCVVYAEKNALLGEIVACKVVLKKGNTQDQNTLKKALKRHCIKHLEAHKIPVKIIIVDSLATSDRFKKLR
ncbi:AMP-binding protein [bacterium]|nr:AMP-binding protein [bacterium]